MTLTDNVPKKLYAIHIAEKDGDILENIFNIDDNHFYGDEYFFTREEDCLKMLETLNNAKAEYQQELDAFNNDANPKMSLVQFRDKTIQKIIANHDLDDVDFSSNYYITEPPNVVFHIVEYNLNVNAP